jgi:hypothetical protein
MNMNENLIAIIIALLALLGTIVSAIISYMSNTKQQRSLKELEKTKCSIDFLKLSFERLKDFMIEIRALEVDIFKNDNFIIESIKQGQEAEKLYEQIKPFFRLETRTILGNYLKKAEEHRHVFTKKLIELGISPLDDFNMKSKKKHMEYQNLVEICAKNYIICMKEFYEELKDKINSEMIYLGDMLRKG